MRFGMTLLLLAAFAALAAGGAGAAPRLVVPELFTSTT